MTGPVFADANLIVHRFDATDPRNRSRAADRLTLLWNCPSERVSFQVLQEAYAVLTRKLQPAMAAADAQRIVRGLAAWRPVALELRIPERARLLQERRLLSWWDALIAAAAQTCGCKVLLTGDLQHGYHFDEVRVVDPFGSPDPTPEEVLESMAL